MKRHKIKFRKDVELSVYPPRTGKEKSVTQYFMPVSKGQTMQVHTRPYVTTTAEIDDDERKHVKIVERCDLYLPDGSEATGVPFAYFRFVED